MSVSLKKYYEFPGEHSLIKIEIVVSYFVTWLKVMASRTRNTITYLDLFAGPGSYKNGAPATPLKILDAINLETSIHSRIKLIFYDESKWCIEELNSLIENHPVYKKLKHKPLVIRKKIDKESVRDLEVDDTTFTFVDPWGHKDQSLELYIEIMQEWGNDCIINFSTSGINRNIKEETQEKNMKNLFGEREYNNLLREFEITPKGLSREFLLLNTFISALESKLGKKLYSLNFAMNFRKKKRTNYHLIFLSKHKLGFKIMRGILTSRSAKDHKNMPLFVNEELSLNKELQGQLELGESSKLFNELKANLMIDFNEQTILVKDLFARCLLNGYKYDNPLIREALHSLRDNGKILPIEDRRKKKNNDFGDLVVIKFT